MNDEKKELSIYIHIPFCKRKCKYCDFLSFSGCGIGEQKEYIDALCNEIGAYDLIADDYKVGTIFFGGGTPSFIPAEYVGRILVKVREIFTVDKNAEITIEGNPDSLTRDKIEKYKSFGINRLSIGLQSTNDEMLKCLGRVHNYDQFVAAYSRAREAGFDNINVDIMSGLPGESIESYVRTLGKVVDMQPEHISAYSLIVEDGTPLAENDELLDKLPSEELDRKQYARTKLLLGQSGYERYEISNYAKIGYECSHNLRYWTGGEYLGVGLGAASYLRLNDTTEFPMSAYDEQYDVETEMYDLYSNSLLDYEMEDDVDDSQKDVLKTDIDDSKENALETDAGVSHMNASTAVGNDDESGIYVRFKGVDNIDEYIGRFSRFGTGYTDILSAKELIGNCYTEIQVLKSKDRMEEFMFLGLRCIAGISRSQFFEKFGKDIEQVYGNVIAKYTKSGHLICDGDRVMLSDKGLDVSNTIMAEFLL